ncbi:MAG: hypothetical protein HY537_18145 [Deltaproteobacteria bacterium]|nr:hypothetical protein [Deltaproteobacteria bacterium]
MKLFVCLLYIAAVTCSGSLCAEHVRQTNRASSDESQRNIGYCGKQAEDAGTKLLESANAIQIPQLESVKEVGHQSVDGVVSSRLYELKYKIWIEPVIASRFNLVQKDYPFKRILQIKTSSDCSHVEVLKGSDVHSALDKAASRMYEINGSPLGSLVLVGLPFKGEHASNAVRESRRIITGSQASQKEQGDFIRVPVYSKYFRTIPVYSNPSGGTPFTKSMPQKIEYLVKWAEFPLVTNKTSGQILKTSSVSVSYALVSFNLSENEITTAEVKLADRFFLSPEWQ